MTRINLSDRSKNIYFDTSIYNRLLDDPDKCRLVQIIRNNNFIVIPSIINLCEMLMTGDPTRKESLIQIHNELRNGFYPLKPLPWLLRDSVESIEKGNNDFEFNYPISINPETEIICSDLMKQKGVELGDYLRGARYYVQRISRKEKLEDEYQYFAYLDSGNGEQFLVNHFDFICKTENIGSSLDRDMKLTIIRSHLMPWKYYLEAYAYLCYLRAFSSKSSGKRSNPGPIDIEQCVYLFWAGKIVIEDNNFSNFVKKLKRIRNYDLEIMNYRDCKNYIFS